MFGVTSQPPRLVALNRETSNMRPPQAARRATDQGPGTVPPSPDQGQRRSRPSKPSWPSKPWRSRRRSRQPPDAPPAQTRRPKGPCPGQSSTKNKTQSTRQSRKHSADGAETGTFERQSLERKFLPISACRAYFSSVAPLLPSNRPRRAANFRPSALHRPFSSPNLIP